jgi:hypothetical protein
MPFRAQVGLSFLLLCLLAGPAALAQGSQSKDSQRKESQRKTTALRTLTRHEGLAIMRTALYSRQPTSSPSDCSHLVHALYERAGFPYDYAPSSDLYAGIDEFRRVANPQPGDLAIWRGHAGIVVNPVEHSFFSLLSSGPGVDFWDSQYWRQRGRPRFFRYIKHAPSGTVAGSIRTTNLKQ